MPALLSFCAETFQEDDMIGKRGLRRAECKILFHLNRFNKHNSTKQAHTLTVMSAMELLCIRRPY